MSAKENFLKKNSLSEFEILPMQTDCSLRFYERISNGKKSLILMNCPPKGENIDMFIIIAKFLQNEGFSAPSIIDYDEMNGLLLLEDFGDKSLTKVFGSQQNLEMEQETYFQAIDLLVKLHSISPAKLSLPKYDFELLMKELMVFINFYIPIINGSKLNDAQISEYETMWKSLLDHLNILPEVITLRDYHADNLMFLEERSSYKKIGLLDFQDAVIGSPAYDLVSLLEDARRDVPKKIVDACIDRYIESINGLISRRNFLAAYYILGAQRNCKIAGIFARKASEGNSAYLKMIPRVLNHLKNDLKHPLLLPLRNWLATHLPGSFELELHESKEFY